MTFHAVYCFDGNYEAHFGASIVSLILNFRQPGGDLHIHVITPHDTPEFVERLDRLRATFACRIELIHPTAAQIARLSGLPIESDALHYMTRATWLRLLIPDLLPEVDRVLYIDADTIIRECVSALFAEADAGAVLQGVADLMESRMAGHHGIGQYVNSGVLLMALDAWRREGHASGCIATAQAHAQKIMFADQCALNLHFGERIRKMPARWNQYVTQHRSQPLVPGGILHFVSSNKPWHSWYRHPAGELYWRYRKVSPWHEGEAEAPRTVRQHAEQARKLAALGQSAEAIGIYEKLLATLANTASGEPRE